MIVNGRRISRYYYDRDTTDDLMEKYSLVEDIVVDEQHEYVWLNPNEYIHSNEHRQMTRDPSVSIRFPKDYGEKMVEYSVMAKLVY